MAKDVCDIFNGAVKKEERLLAEDKKLIKRRPKGTAKTQRPSADKVVAERLKSRTAYLKQLEKESVTDFSKIKSKKPPRPKSEVQMELADVQREIRQLEGAKQQLHELFEQMRKNERFTAESESRIKEYFEKLSKTDKADLRNKRLLKEAHRRISAQAKGKVSSEMVAWSEGSMLSSPTTWGLAMIESGFTMPLFTGLGRTGQRFKRFVSGAKTQVGETTLADAMFGLKVKMREFMPAVRGAYDFMSDYSFKGVHKARVGEFDFDRVSPTADSRFLDSFEEAFKDVLEEETGLGLMDKFGRWVSNQYRLPRHLIQTADKFSGHLNYMGEMATEASAWARREVDLPQYAHLTPAQKDAKIALLAEEQMKVPSVKLVESAKERARLYALVQQPESVTGQNIAKLSGNWSMARFVLPFAKTWINSVEIMLKSDPVLQGLQKTFSRVPYVGDFFRKVGLNSVEDIAPRRRALYKAMATGGATIMGGAITLHQMGRLTGEYVGGAKPAGWQPNSVLINGRYYSYNRLGVVGGFMKMGVNFSETTDQAVYYGKQREWEKAAYSVMGGVGKHGVLLLTPHTVLSTIDFISGLSGANKGTGVMGALRDPDVARTIQNMGNRFIPALSFQRWLNRMTDGKSKETGKVTVENMSDFMSKWGADLKRSLPFAGQNLPARVDVFGDELGSGTPATVFGRAFGALYPIKMQDVKDGEIMEWFNDVGFFKNPYVHSRKESIMNRTLNFPRHRYVKEGERIDLEPQEYAYLMRASAGLKSHKEGESYTRSDYSYEREIDETTLKEQLRYQMKNGWPFITENFASLVEYNREAKFLTEESEGVAHLNPRMQRYAFHKIYEDYKAMGKYYLEQKYGEDLDGRIDRKRTERQKRELELFKESQGEEKNISSLLQEGRTPITDLAGVDPIDADDYMEDDDIAMAEEQIEEASRKYGLRNGYYDPTSWYKAGADMKETVLDNSGKIWDDDVKNAYIQEMDEEVLG